VEASLFKGVHYEMTVSCEGETWIIHSTRCVEAGETIGMKVAPENIHVMKRMFPDEENIIEAEVVKATGEADGFCTVRFDGTDLVLPTEKLLSEGETVTLAISPADAELCDPEDEIFSGVLDSVVWKGSHYEMILLSEHRRWLIKSQMDEQAGSEVSFRFRPECVRIVEGAEK
jgi:spermidine/putrescine transport system ATP-binding protein